MPRLQTFTFMEMMEIGSRLRCVAENAPSIEFAAQQIADFFCEEFKDPISMRSDLILARSFRTLSYGNLTEELRACARVIAGGAELAEETRCLTLMGSRGDREEWNSRHGSKGHKAIPLQSEYIVENMPMIAKLAKSLGLEASALVRPNSELLLEKERKGFNVYHIDDAEGSPYIPAQDWVRANGVRSVIGFGMVMPPVDLFATVLFARVKIDRGTAELFKTLALSVKMALLPHAGLPLFS